MKLVASEMQPIWDDLSQEELVVILPCLKNLLEDVSTAIMAAWFLFEPLAKALGPSKANHHLLSPIISIYEGHDQTSKHLKLYHRTFLQFLIVRFGTNSFLRYFSTYLIEAVGGYKDYDDASVRPLREGLEKLWVSREGQLHRSETTTPEVTPDRRSFNRMDTGSEEIVALNENSLSSLNARTPVEDSLAEGEVFAFDSVSLEDSNQPQQNPKLDSCAKDYACKGLIDIPAYKVCKTSDPIFRKELLSDFLQNLG